MARFVPAPNLDAEIRRLTQDVLLDRANRIAAATRATAKMARSYPGRYGAITVSAAKAGATVAAQGSLAHLDEWGSINNSPTAAMRRAAEREGRFREE